MNTIKLRAARFAAALCALAIILAALAGCGGETVQPGGVGQTAGTTTMEEPLGAGFTQNHASAAGYGLGSDTYDDIIGRFGAPLSSESEEYTALTITTAEYPFGSFEFRGAKGETEVLTYVGIHSDKTAPCGIAFGMDITQAAEIIYTGSTALLSDLSQQKIILYGDDASASSGVFNWLTMEYTSSSTAEKYSLVFTTGGYEDNKRLKYCLYFDTDYKLVWYELQYLTLQ